MDHYKIIKEQLLHVVFGALIFVVIGAFAVGLDLAAGLLHSIGVSGFTGKALNLAAHSLFVADLVLFFVYILSTGYDLIKMMIKR